MLRTGAMLAMATMSAFRRQALRYPGREHGIGHRVRRGHVVPVCDVDDFLASPVRMVPAAQVPLIEDVFTLLVSPGGADDIAGLRTIRPGDSDCIMQARLDSRIPPGDLVPVATDDTRSRRLLRPPRGAAGSLGIRDGGRREDDVLVHGADHLRGLGDIGAPSPATVFVPILPVA